MKRFFFYIAGFIVFTSANNVKAQGAPPQIDPRMYEIITNVSADRIESDIRTLAGFGTRNTFSDTLSDIFSDNFSISMD